MRLQIKSLDSSPHPDQHNNHTSHSSSNHHNISHSNTMTEKTFMDEAGYLHTFFENDTGCEDHDQRGHNQPTTGTLPTSTSTPTTNKRKMGDPSSSTSSLSSAKINYKKHISVFDLGDFSTECRLDLSKIASKQGATIIPIVRNNDRGERLSLEFPPCTLSIDVAACQDKFDPNKIARSVLSFMRPSNECDEERLYAILEKFEEQMLNAVLAEKAAICKESGLSLRSFANIDTLKANLFSLVNRDETGNYKPSLRAKFYLTEGDCLENTFIDVNMYVCDSENKKFIQRKCERLPRGSEIRFVAEITHFWINSMGAKGLGFFVREVKLLSLSSTVRVTRWADEDETQTEEIIVCAPGENPMMPEEHAHQQDQPPKKRARVAAAQPPSPPVLQI